MMLFVLLALTQTPTTTTIQVHGPGINSHVFSFGDTLTIDATVRAVGHLARNAPAITGTVDILVDGSPNDVTVNSKGVAELPISTLTVGPHTIDAVYNGDNNYGPSNATTFTLTINPAVTHTDLTVTPHVGTTSTTFTLTAHVSSGWGFSWRGHSIPVTEGTIDFIIDGTIASSSTPDGSGNAVFTTTLAKGTHTIVASFEGDANYNASRSCTSRVCVVGPPTHNTPAPSHR